MTIPVLDPNVARDTKIILSKVGDDYYYDKVWVQGKSYGYQFILPKEARARQRELLAIHHGEVRQAPADPARSRRRPLTAQTGTSPW
jgi:hypothetical protein